MQNESSGKKALRAGLGYTIGNILVKGLTFISIPIFARLLSVADYGLYNTFGSYVTIMTFVVGLTLHTSVRNAKLDFPDRIDAFCSSRDDHYPAEYGPSGGSQCDLRGAAGELLGPRAAVSGGTHHRGGLALR